MTGTTRSQPASRSQRGFTLLEVLVVMAILSVLMGFGIGMFRQLTTMGVGDQARSTIVDTIQQVKTSSLTWPSALVVNPKENILYGQEYRIVNLCQFEDEDASGIVALYRKHGKPLGEYELRPYPWGHTGGALVCEKGGTIDFGSHPEYNLREGVSIDVWVYPTESQPMTLIAKGRSFGIRLLAGRAGPVVEGFLRLAEDAVAGTTTGESSERYAVEDHPLALNRWNRIVFSYDRSAITVALDLWGHGAVERLRIPEKRRIAPDPEARLMVGGDQGPFIGRMDDLRIAGILAGDERALPPEIELLGEPRKIFFTGGRLDPTVHQSEQTIALLAEGIEERIVIGVLGNILVK